MISIAGHPFGLGALLALIGLILVIVLWIAHIPLTSEDILGLFALGFVARLVP